MVTIFILIAVLLSAAYVFTKRSKGSHQAPPVPLKKTPEPAPLFIRDWPLLDFALEFGPKMQVGQETRNNEETYHICRFTKEDGTITRVCFFSQLGELTPAEIQARKNELYVGQMSSGKYYLHDKNVTAWETVDLGL